MPTCRAKCRCTDSARPVGSSLVVVARRLGQWLNRRLRYIGLEVVRSSPPVKGLAPVRVEDSPGSAQRPGSRLICFSLYGNEPRYVEGAVANATLYGEVFPGWSLVFFVGASAPKAVREFLDGQDHCFVVDMSDFPENPSATLWRFSPMSWTSAEVVMFRDLDSRPTRRERAAVDEWLASDRAFHAMRDHPFHKEAILAGMWGVRNAGMFDLAKSLRAYGVGETFGSDQRFLRSVVYPRAIPHLLVHQDFNFFNDPPEVDVRPFPLTRSRDTAFVGQGFEADGSVRVGHEPQPLPGVPVSGHGEGH
jgi:hypothetical protein